ncbi:MAG: hypothetical protein KDB26_08385 [Microthrixaceae bacterium]|nr:hypothetical protein [Microthrixaceae bacterium]
MTINENPSVPTSQAEGRDNLRAQLWDISLRRDPHKPDGIPPALDFLWEELADELDRLDEWLADASRIGGLTLSRSAEVAADTYTRAVYRRWRAAVNKHVAAAAPESCSNCDAVYHALDRAGIEYEVVSA